MAGSMQHRKLIISFSSFLIAASLVAITTVKSQNTTNQGSGLSVSPPTFELTGNPGDTITNTVRFENTSDEMMKIAVDRRNFTAIGEEGAVGLTEEETSFSLASWISVEPENALVPAKSTRTFRYTIKVPLSAEPGGHFGSLIFRTVPSESLEGSGATLAQELGSLVLLRIAGESKEDAKIESFSAENYFSEYGPIIIATRVNNLGNVHLKPTGMISISNMFGQKVATVPLDSKNILPRAVRRLDSTWDTKWRLGRYTATLVMVYGKDMTQRAVVTNFIVFPYKIAAVVAIVLITLSFLL